MKEKLGVNIARYRKESKMTQEELAKQLNISYQAVSKWENGQTLPDVEMLSRIAEIMHVSMDALAGFPHHYHSADHYEMQYRKEEYFWGVNPSGMCLKILELMPPNKPLKFLDIGCGEGKDAVFMARCGYQVSAFDISDAGIEKTKKLAEKAGVYVDVFKGDVNNFQPEEKYDIIFSSGVFQYIKPKFRSEMVHLYKECTKENGLNVFQVFVEKPFIASAPDHQKAEILWKSGEILTEYYDWLIEDFREEIFDCNSSGIPHKHADNVIFARKK